MSHNSIASWNLLTVASIAQDIDFRVISPGKFWDLLSKEINTNYFKTLTSSPGAAELT